MVVFDDEGGAAGDLARELHGRLQRLGVYEPEARPWLPHITVVRFRERPRLTPPLPGLGASLRPVLLFTCLGCGRPGPSMSSSGSTG